MSLLIIGKGWAGTYIESLALETFNSVLCTTRDGRNSTIEFNFTDPTDIVPFKRLPQTDYVVITFPFVSTDMARAFLNLYGQTRDIMPKMILLGSTRPFVGNGWATSDSPLDKNSDPIRTLSEELVLKGGGSVLHLAGLWDEKRDPKGWIARIAPTKNELALKSSLHLIHGTDVASAVVHSFIKFCPGKRWIVTDLRVYDWWDLVLCWGNETQKSWVKELIQ
jgi:hypothetical protein